MNWVWVGRNGPFFLHLLPLKIPSLWARPSKGAAAAAAAPSWGFLKVGWLCLVEPATFKRWGLRAYGLYCRDDMYLIQIEKFHGSQTEFLIEFYYIVDQIIKIFIVFCRSKVSHPYRDRGTPKGTFRVHALEAKRAELAGSGRNKVISIFGFYISCWLSQYICILRPFQ